MNEKGISLVQLRQRKTRQTAALFLAPVIILLVVFIAYPIIDTFITSGYQWNGISADKKMVGLANWAKQRYYHDRIYHYPDSVRTCNGNIP